MTNLTAPAETIIEKLTSCSEMSSVRSFLNEKGVVTYCRILHIGGYPQDSLFSERDQEWGKILRGFLRANIERVAWIVDIEIKFLVSTARLQDVNEFREYPDAQAVSFYGEHVDIFYPEGNEWHHNQLAMWMAQNKNAVWGAIDRAQRSLSWKKNIPGYWDGVTYTESFGRLDEEPYRGGQKAALRQIAHVANPRPPRSVLVTKFRGPKSESQYATRVERIVRYDTERITLPGRGLSSRWHID